jgi:hypothetical protein
MGVGKTVAELLLDANIEGPQESSDPRQEKKSRSIEAVMEEMTSDPRYKDLSPNAQKAAREHKLRTATRARELAVKQDAALVREYDKNHTGESLKGFATGVLDTATFGQIPNIVGALGGDEAEEALRRKLEARAAARPVSTTAGEMAGYFVGPAGVVGRAVSTVAASGMRLATGRAALLAGKVGVPTVVMGAMEKSFFGRFMAATGENVAGGSAAIVAQRALEDNNGSNMWGEDSASTRGYSLSSRIDSVTSDLSHPLTAALMLGGAGVSTALTKSRSKEMAKAIAFYEKETGQKVPVEVLTDSFAYSQFMDNLRALPGSLKVQEATRTGLLAGFHKIAEKVRVRAGVADSAKAGAAARAAAGSQASEGVVTGVRRGTGARAIQEADGIGPLPETVHVELRAGLETVLSRRQGGAYGAETGIATAGRTKAQGARGGELTSAVKNILAASRKLKRTPRKGVEVRDARGRLVPKGHLTERSGQLHETMYVSDLEDMRKQLARIAYSRGRNPQMGMHSQADVREARDLYHVLGNVIESASPKYRRKLELMDKYRAMERGFKHQDVPQIDNRAAREFWSSKDILPRLDYLEQVSLPGDRQALTAWYLSDFIDNVFDPSTGFVSSAKMKAFLKGGGDGRFDRQIMDRVMPGLADDMVDMAKLNEKMKRAGGTSSGPLGSEGSSTARRQFSGLNMGLNLVNLGGAAFLSQMLTNPFISMGSLGLAGTKFLILKQLASLQGMHAASENAAIKMLRKGQDVGALPNLRLSVGRRRAELTRGGASARRATGQVLTAANSQSGEDTAGNAREATTQQLNDLQKRSLP